MVTDSNIQFYNSLSLISPDAIAVCDIYGNVEYFSPKIKGLLLIDDGIDCTTFNIRDFIHASNLALATQMYEMLIRKQISVNPRLLLVRADGSTFYGDILSTIAKDKNSDNISVIMAVRDITEIKAAEDALRRSEEQFRQLTVASPDAITVCSLDGKIKFLSKAAKRLLLVEDEVDETTLTFMHFVHPSNLQKAVQMYNAVVQSHTSVRPELLLRRADNSAFYAEISSATLTDEDGKTTAITMVVRDITERKDYEAKLIAAKEKAERADQLKAAFLANISHEIRTPLNAITGFLNLINAEGNLSDLMQESVKNINESSNRLIKLINSIVDIAKITTLQLELQAQPVDINNLMIDLEAKYKSITKDVEFILDDSWFTYPCIINVDIVRLTQIFDNLIENAIKFTDKGFICFGYKQSSPASIDFFVEDSGIGIAAEDLEIIFDLFRQIELGNSRQYEGAGIGLPLSRGLAVAMGGDLSVKSEKGKGTTVSFTIPYKKD